MALFENALINKIIFAYYSEMYVDDDSEQILCNEHQIDIIIVCNKSLPQYYN